MMVAALEIIEEHTRHDNKNDDTTLMQLCSEESHSGNFETGSMMIMLV